jgi:hypothetical protein
MTPRGLYPGGIERNLIC